MNCLETRSAFPACWPPSLRQAIAQDRAPQSGPEVSSDFIHPTPFRPVTYAHFSQTGASKNTASPVFSYRCAHLQKQWGMAPLKIQKFGKLSLPLRTNPMSLPACPKTSFPLHPPPHGGTISSVTRSLHRETFPLAPVSKIRERTTGSTARLIQQSAMDRRPGPLAIRRRNPVHVLRPGKASSVRLGSIVGP